MYRLLTVALLAISTVSATSLFNVSDNSPAMTDHFRRAGWLPASDEHLHKWMQAAVDEVTVGKRKNGTLLPVVQDFLDFIEMNAEMYMGFHQMFEEQPPSSLLSMVPDYQTMFKLFNKIIQEAPPYGPIGPPMYMIINGAMNTQAGFTTFLDTELNSHFRTMFNTWAKFLDSPDSRYVLNTGEGGWFNSSALSVLTEFYGGLTFEQIYVSDPSKPYWGYKSWDDYFVRLLRPGVRAVTLPGNQSLISAACESQLYNLATDVKAEDTFWVKGEPYSLLHMLNHDELAPQFIGGTVFQGFLSVTSYHRWHAPGFIGCSPPRRSGEPNNPFLRSLSFITALTTRMLIFIESDNPNIGMMVFIAIGMTEVSTCEATVKEGQHVQRGDELGMFHFGGSSHALVFRPETKLQFFDNVSQPGDQVEVRAAIAGVM
ncbi:Phosphatidylserine decarboxylase [Mycena venus]|uniref:Phosphatidylserine decarboxylase n=1 Tax=Mycena venus TaxID=2733690 RepID=A0A8H7CKC3_9AGAR|nr:Phosphatidylserine decarboxylase [Mycena venus]